MKYTKSAILSSFAGVNLPQKHPWASMPKYLRTGLIIQIRYSFAIEGLSWIYHARIISMERSFSRSLLPQLASSLLHRSFRRSILGFKIITHLLHRNPFHSFVFVNVLNDSLHPVSSVIWDNYKNGMTCRSCISKTCGRPETSGWIVIGKINSSYSR
jgi:hypothetical protein